MTPFGLQRDAVRSAAVLGRRDVLRLVGVAAAAGMVPSGCGQRPEWLTPPVGAELAVLSPRTYAVLTAATMRVVGPTGAAMIASREVEAGLVADRWLVGAPVAAGPLQTALLTLEFGVPPLVRKLRPFTSLPASAQDTVLDDLMRSGWSLKRQLFGGIRSLGLLAFYGSPASRAVTGYPGPFGDETVTIGDAMVGGG